MAKLLSGSRIYGNATVDTFLVVSGTTVSTSTTTGALTVGGGAGFGGNLYAAGNAVIGGNLQLGASGYITTTPGSNANITIDPDGVGDVVFTPNTEVFIQSNANATSKTVGALVVTGGISTQGNIYSNAIYTTTGLYWAGNNNVINIGTSGGTPVGVSGAIQYNSGGTLAAANLIYYSGNNTVVANANVEATSNVSGTFQVIGGIGATGNIWASNVYTVNGLYWAGNGSPISTGSNFPYIDMGFITDPVSTGPAIFDAGTIP